MARPDPRVGRLFLGGGVRPTSNSTGMAKAEEKQKTIKRKQLVILMIEFFIVGRMYRSAWLDS